MINIYNEASGDLDAAVMQCKKPNSLYGNLENLCTCFGVCGAGNSTGSLCDEIKLYDRMALPHHQELTAVQSVWPLYILTP